VLTVSVILSPSKKDKQERRLNVNFGVYVLECNVLNSIIMLVHQYSYVPYSCRLCKDILCITQTNNYPSFKYQFPTSFYSTTVCDVVIVSSQFREK